MKPINPKIIEKGEKESQRIQGEKNWEKAEWIEGKK